MMTLVDEANSNRQTMIGRRPFVVTSLDTKRYAPSKKPHIQKFPVIPLPPLTDPTMSHKNGRMVGFVRHFYAALDHVTNSDS